MDTAHAKTAPRPEEGARVAGRTSRRPRPTHSRAAALLVPAALLLGGCGGPQNMLDPHSKAASQVATLWWGMLAAATVVMGGTIVFLIWGWFRRRKEGLPFIGNKEPVNETIVVVFGIVVPIICLVIVFAIANLSVIRTTEAPAKSSTTMTIHVVGRQWFWQVEYPGTGAVTANEIHIPVRTRVNLLATTADVIHSFWVPELNRKIDMIPGHPNRILLYADKPGVYRGQCAEFCGLQHAHMAMKVYAQPRAQFQAWLNNMASPARTPATPMQRRGQRVFLTSECSSCHQIRGTPAKGQVGPDLTHLQTRGTLAALTIPNRKGYLAGWVLDPQHVKPGVKMPGLNLKGPDFQALLAYLESLR